MEWFEPLIIVAVVAFVGLVIFFHFYNKKKGRGSSCGSCSGNCTSCGGSCHYNCQKLLDEYHKANKTN